MKVHDALLAGKISWYDHEPDTVVPRGHLREAREAFRRRGEDIFDVRFDESGLLLEVVIPGTPSGMKTVRA